MGGFLLSKWYFDVVTEDGAVAIAYAARLELGPIRLDYASVLARDATGPTRESSALSAARVTESADEITLDGLALAGTWTRRCPAIDETLLADCDGHVRWRCHMPSADARVTLDATPLAGLGYVEHLELTIPPWRLPLETLRWGHVLAPRGARVWIDWQSRSFSRSLEYCDGVAAPFSERVFSNETVLRSGRIGSTALGVLGREVLSRVPGSTLLIDETKWRALVDGHWAIHETVSWP